MPISAPVEQFLSFNPAMQAALKARRKTVTRRRFAQSLAMNQDPGSYRFLGMEGHSALFEKHSGSTTAALTRVDCPFGMPGARLRVAEVPGILLQIERVWAEQVQAITEAQALAEGIVAELTPCADGWSTGLSYRADPDDISCPFQASAVAAFQVLIDSIYPTAWIRNEWVWVIGFKPVP
jgi:hypothetical protein